MIKKKEDFSTITQWTDYIGNYAEVRFHEECAARNIRISKPTTITQYDVIIERDKKLSKIQIKAVSHHSTNIMQFILHRQSAYKKKNCPYNKENVDFFVIYSIGYDKLYMIPSSLIFSMDTNKSINFYDSEICHDSCKVSTAIDISKYKNW